MASTRRRPRCRPSQCTTVWAVSTGTVILLTEDHEDTKGHLPKTIPIVVVTADALEKMRVEAMEAGADAHLTKPCGLILPQFALCFAASTRSAAEQRK